MSMRSRLARALASLLLVVVAGAAGLVAQDQFGGGRGRNRRPALDGAVQGNTEYDGRFVFVRLRYSTGFGGGGFGRRGIPPWSHDYPDGEVHFSRILDELTLVNMRTDGSNILALDDPELCNYPVAYMAEPGFWGVSEAEATAFRQYLQKGGFAIFDDFRGYDWENLQEQMRHVLPDARWIELDGSAQIFHSFFEIHDPLSLSPPYGGLPPSYWGIYEKNDPKKRLMVIANVNNDISEYWEFSGTGYAPVDVTNEAYKFGVNFFMYGLIH